MCTTYLHLFPALVALAAMFRLAVNHAEERLNNAARKVFGALRTSMLRLVISKTSLAIKFPVAL